MKIGTLLHPSWLAESLIRPSKEGILSSHILRCMEAGAEHIELTGEIFTLAPKNLLTLLKKEISQILFHYKEERGLTFSVHLPYMGGLDISSSVQAIRHATLEVFRNIVDITRPIEPLSYILHVGGMIQEATSGDLIGEAIYALRNLLLNNVLVCLQQMATFIDPEKICIENLPSTTSEFLEKIVKKSDLSICLDIGHLTVRGDSLEDFLKRHSKKIREIHLHDVKRFYYGPFIHVNVDHQALGQGELPMAMIIDLISNYGFSGPLVLEALRDNEITSIKILKELLAQRTHKDECER